MAVFRVHKTDNYTVMSNQHLRDERLSLKAKGLLSLMLSLPDDWDYSAKGLATLSRDGEDAVKSALKELEEYKYLTRTSVRENGVIRDWKYDIYETPQGDFPQVEKPLVEKQSQINTNIINTKEINNTFTNVKVEQPAVTPKNDSLKQTRRVPLVDTPNPPKKKNLYEKCLDEIDVYTDDAELRELLKTYLPIRFARKDIVINLPTFKGMLKTLSRVAETREDKINSIQQSIDRQYPTFYAVKKYSKYNDRKKFAEGKNGLKLGRDENEVITSEVF